MEQHNTRLVCYFNILLDCKGLWPNKHFNKLLKEVKLKKRGILFARNWCFHDFNFKILHSSSFHLVVFVFFAIFGLGKVLLFCVTKVSGKNQSYSNLYWFCKNLQIGTKCGEKTKLARYPKDQKFQEITKYFRVGKIQF